MAKAVQIVKITRWLKLFTYISATVLLIVNNDLNSLKYLIPLVVILFSVNYFRDYRPAAGKKPACHIWISIAAEMLLIICIGLFDRTDINILFFFVCVSGTIISYPFVYSTLLAAVYIASAFFIFAGRNGFDGLIKSIVLLFLSYGVSTAFVMVMSYIVRLQIREKEKLAHINAELELAYKKLIESSAAARKLSAEQERTRMAGEIHDTLAHTLTTLIVQLEACKKLAARDPSRLPAELEKAQELSRSGFNDIKRTIKALRPQAMEDKTFLASIESIIQDAMENTKIHITLSNLLPEDISLPSHIEVALFRIVQESITNSIRHGQAGEIEIALKQEDNMLVLHITDDGMGCANIKKGYGLGSITERAEGLNGSAEFSSQSGNGFKTKVILPYEAV